MSFAPGPFFCKMNVERFRVLETFISQIDWILLSGTLVYMLYSKSNLDQPAKDIKIFWENSDIGWVLLGIYTRVPKS